MDKTGTLTKGEPEITDLVTADGTDQAELLRLAAAVERNSEHPLAEAIVRRADTDGVAEVPAAEFENIPGHGAIASVNGHRVAVGNRRLMDREGVQLGPLAPRREELAAGGQTAVVVAVDGRAAGLVAIADASRPTARAAVDALHELGVEVVMLTSDNRATAGRIAAELGIDTVIAEVLPGDKAAKVAERQRSGRKVAMVGDGVNDAPALAQADLGIAIGAGTDVVIETADVVLMRSDPLDVPVALRIGRGTLRKMRQNLGWAVGYNAIALRSRRGCSSPPSGWCCARRSPRCRCRAPASSSPSTPWRSSACGFRPPRRADPFASAERDRSLPRIVPAPSIEVPPAQRTLAPCSPVQFSGLLVPLPLARRRLAIEADDDQQSEQQERKGWQEVEDRPSSASEHDHRQAPSPAGNPPPLTIRPLRRLTRSRANG